MIWTSYRKHEHTWDPRESALNRHLDRFSCFCAVTPPPIAELSIVMSVSVCLCVCLSAMISSELHVRSSPNFLCMLPMAVARSFSGGVAICYVFPVLRVTSYLLISQGCSTSPPSWSAVHTQPWAWLWTVRSNTSCRQRTNGTTFRALKVTFYIGGNTGAESAVYDCLVHSWSRLTNHATCDLCSNRPHDAAGLTV